MSYKIKCEDGETTLSYGNSDPTGGTWTVSVREATEQHGS
jgi:hypothetical protein